ncbi:2-dehydropantoate 2-reductase (Ketopantoate reductase) (KPA reductase) (KPR) [Mortierella alpina]|uniref:2-dehydropantoate 2-reductase (Ketopantoate reductase) (KPA reductase) (KPR) n=1 Tax=Mortierella alpina TaxID=64518 RepID=A0A9P6JBN8_MORAP|nr:2-dehydropantoate 2-reductase (Ketopantoate reductase) (KPA reductase) (KPR) [Mortierella alpina]
MTKVPYRPLAPRFHILGPGGIGSLLAFYFHRHNIPFTLFQRKAPPPTPPSLTPATNSNTPATLKYMNLTALDTASVEPQVVDGMGDTIVHTGKGHVWLAPIIDTPSPKVTSGSTKDKHDPSPPKLDSNTLADIGSLLQKPDDGSLFPTLTEPAKAVRSTKYPYTNPSTFIAPFTNAPFSSFYVQPSSPEQLRNLRTRSLYETLAAFQLLSTDMDLKILMPEHLLALQLSKLVVNACVNPVATLLEATNGMLIDSAEAHQAVKDLIKESLSILSHSKEFEALDKSLTDEFLTLETLTKTTETILRATKPNRCSTLQDYLKGSQECEIDYMNGYLIKMAERYGRPAPLNKMVTEKVKDKFAAPRKNPTPVE